MKEIFLSDAPIGSRCTVVRSDGRAAMKRRLMDLGLVEGTEVSPLFEGIFGNPRAYSIRGAVIALRREDTDRISVTVRIK